MSANSGSSRRYVKPQVITEFDRTSVKTIAQTATKIKFWVHDPMTKKWYTPIEFIHRGMTPGFDKNELTVVVLMSPFDGLAAAEVKAVRAQAMYNEFSKRILNYFCDRFGK